MILPSHLRYLGRGLIRFECFLKCNDVKVELVGVFLVLEELHMHLIQFHFHLVHLGKYYIA
jgi:hypothetical protein